ncbi:MAG: response regulator transcription factor [Bacteroidia bacterium]
MNEKIKVLLAEDDANLGSLLKQYLDAKGFDTTLTVNGKEAFDMFVKKQFDICILDVMMPVKDGFTTAKEIRAVNNQIPIVFLTARSQKEDTLEGFSVGADDYITKPFSMEELLARLQAILRRVNNKNISESQQNEFKIGKYKFDYQHQLLSIGDKTQKLTSKEADLLKLLCLNMNNVLDRSFALNAIWHNDSYFNSRSMDVYITKLRKYLKQDERLEIVNVHGKGFKLLVPSED